jgi:hypothetical protein
MGFADLLVRLGIPYNSAEGVEVGRRVMEFLDEESKKASEMLAEKRGAFPEWEKSIWGPDETAARAPNGERIRPVRPLRNCNVTTVAPTGTISIFAGCSSGIEPLFAVAFMRNQAGSLMPDVNEDFVKAAQDGGWYSPELMERIAREGHIHFAEVPEAVQRAFSTAHDITPEWHVRMQAAFQEHCDSAISKTTNFPNEATVQDVRKIYELAFSLGTKGVTVYRDGSRDGLGKAGSVATADVEAIGRLISLSLRFGIPVNEVYQQLRGISSDRAIGFGQNKVLSVPDAIAQAIGLREQEKAGVQQELIPEAVGGKTEELLLPEVPAPDTSGQLVFNNYAAEAETFMGTCPDCSSQLEFAEGCKKCHACGFSECG